MEKLKEFCKKHKKKLFIGSCIISGVVVGIVIDRRLLKNKRLIDITGKAAITWTPRHNGFMDLNRVREILDFNAGNSSSFAIFREGPDPDKYVCILLSKDVILSK